MWLDLVNIFSLEYLLNPKPGPFLDSIFGIITPFFVALLVLAYVSKKMVRKNTYAPVKKFFTKLSQFCVTFGVLGLLYIFFRQQSIYLLSTPVLLLLIFIGALTWGAMILKYYFTDKPEQMEKIKKDQERKKYLPS